MDQNGPFWSKYRGHSLSKVPSPEESQRAPNPPEFAQPRLSRVKARSSAARGYKFGCVCSCMAGHYPGIFMAGHIGTNTPKFVLPRWGRLRFDPTQTGLCKFGWVWSSLSLRKPCDFPCGGNSQAIAILFATFRGKERPHCGLAGDGALATKNRGDLRLRLLALSCCLATLLRLSPHWGLSSLDRSHTPPSCPAE